MQRVRISVPLLADQIACLLALLIVFWTPNNILFKASHAHSTHVLCTLTILFFVLGLHYFTPPLGGRTLQVFTLEVLLFWVTVAPLFTIIVFCLNWSVFLSFVIYVRISSYIPFSNFMLKGLKKILYLCIMDF